MKADATKFDVAQVPTAVWNAMLAYYKNKDLIDLLKREPDLRALTKGYQLATRNVQIFRKNLMAGMARDERFAAPVYFDWLEDQTDLDQALKEFDDDRSDEDDSITFEAKTVKAWIKEGLDREVLWIYMHCSADRFSEGAFKLVDPDED